MFDSVRINSFRSLRDVAVDGLDLINVITGENGSGKTTLLEALFFLVGSRRANVLQDLERIRRSVPEGPGALGNWRWVFPGGSVEDRIEVAGRRKGLGTAVAADFDCRAVAEFVGIRKSSVPAPAPAPPAPHGALPAAEASTSDFGEPELRVLRYEPGSPTPIELRARVSGSEVNYGSLRDDPPDRAIYLGASHVWGSEDALRYDQLRSERKHQPVLDAMRCVEPRVKTLELGFGRIALPDQSIASVPIIRVEIAGSDSLMPMHTLGNGAQRCASVAGVIATVKEAVFVDEIENGLHHSVQKAVWSGILKAAKQRGVQVFATTHSAETLRAARAAVIEAGENCFAFHRIERTSTGHRVVSAGVETVGVAFESGWEIR